MKQTTPLSIPISEISELPQTPIIPIPILICHKCKTSIPLLTLSNKTSQLSLKIQCNRCRSLNILSLQDYLTLIKKQDTTLHYCTLQEDHFLITAEKYCLNCNKWLCQICIEDHNSNLKYRNDSMLNRELNLNAICSTHIGRPYTYYCNECNVSICQKCFDQSHFNHNVTDLELLTKDIQHIDSDRDSMLQSYKAIREKNMIMKDSLMRLVDMEIEQLNKVKEYLQSAYNDNDKNNELIIDLFSIACENFRLLKRAPSYELLMSLKSNFALNKNEAKLDDPSLKVNSANCIRFLITNHIVTIRNEIKYIRTIPAHNNGLSCLLQLIDGRLASGSFDTTIKIWNTKYFNCEITLHGHEQKVYALAQLVNNGRLISGSLDCTIRIWDVILWTCVSTIDQHTNSVFALLSLSNSQFASGSGDKTIKFWDNMTCNYLFSLEEHTDAVSCLIECADGRLSSGSWDNTVKLWALDEKRSLFTFDGHSNQVISLIQLKDGRLVSGSSDKTIRIWDCVKFTQVGVLKGCLYYVFSLVQLRDCGVLSGDQSLRLWNVSAVQSLLALYDNKSLIRCMIELKDGRVVSGSDDNNIKVWNV